MNSVFSYILRIKSLLKSRVSESCCIKYKILIVEDNKLYSLLLNQVFKECMNYQWDVFTQEKNVWIVYLGILML
jgi:hypothetical protein